MASRISTLKFLFILLSSLPDITSYFSSPTSDQTRTISMETSSDSHGSETQLMVLQILQSRKQARDARIPAFKRAKGILCFAPIPSWFYKPSTHILVGAELLFLAAGSLEVGFVDTTNKLSTQNSPSWCDMFVFPKGLEHFQYNGDQTIHLWLFLLSRVQMQALLHFLKLFLPPRR
ncbi:hypothetical protein DITRI_Ditri05aG0058300 [Diplodiscus trichospermus]